MALRRNQNADAAPKNPKSVQKIFRAAGQKADRALDSVLKLSDFSCMVTLSTAARCKRGVVRAAKAVWAVVRKPLRKLGMHSYLVFRRTLPTLTAPYYAFKGYFSVIRRRHEEAKAANRSTADAFFATLYHGIKNNGRLIRRTVLNYTLPVVAIAGLWTIVHLTTTLTFAVDVNYNGKEIGTVSGENVYTDAESIFLQRIVYDKGEKPIEPHSVLTVKLASKDEIIDTDTLVNKMIDSSGEEVSQAVGVYVNGKLVGSVADAEPVKQALNALLATYKKSNTTSLTFEDKVELKNGLYLADSIKDTQSVVQLLKSNKVEEKTYRIHSGDTIERVAKKFNIRKRTFLKLNPDAKRKFLKGGTVKIRASVPYLTVRETRRIRYTKTVDYHTVYVKDSSQLKGHTEVIRDGKEGKSRYTADVSYVNGVEVDRKILKKVVLRAPVDRKIARGTKTVSVTYSAGADAHISGDSQFIWPVNGGYTSDHYGGSRSHKGTDIAAPAGTSVYASASGRVSLAGWWSGYGNCVIIDHGNGIQTLYGHNSAIYVSVGQQVRQGQNISAVGQTGQATGNHCHFEIRLNGSCVNPEPYIGTR